jgi:hypothetical protein
MAGLRLLAGLNVAGPARRGCRRGRPLLADAVQQAAAPRDLGGGEHVEVVPPECRVPGVPVEGGDGVLGRPRSASGGSSRCWARTSAGLASRGSLTANTPRVLTSRQFGFIRPSVTGVHDRTAPAPNRSATAAGKDETTTGG